MSNVAALPFTLAPALDAADLRDARRVRALAYAHHLPLGADAFGQHDPMDHADGTSVWLCRDKATGQALGTARWHDSTHGRLQIEQSVSLPDALRAGPRAEITRLAIRAGADPRVRLALMKAAWLEAMARGVEHLVVGARLPGLIRVYQALGFEDLLPPGEMRPLAHAGNLPHRILSLNLEAAPRRWAAQAHRLLGFMQHTLHPDIQAPARAAPLAQAA